MSMILVKQGVFRNKQIINKSFKLIKGFHTLKLGSYVTVVNDGQYGVDSSEIKIKVNKISDISFLNDQNNEENNVSNNSIENVKTVESDEQAMNRIAMRFSILDTMTKAAINGDIRAMIVSGPPGVGKSYGVERQLEKASLFDKLAERKTRFEIVKGAMTPIGLYSTLYRYSDCKNVLVFDDCDSVLLDDLALNILKAALDSGKRRRIFWNSDSSLLRREGIPDHYDFNGSVIFITNLNFSSLRSKKLQDHLEALQSRCHYIDLTIDSERDKMLRIKGVHRDALKNDIEGLFTGYNFENNEHDQIINFMWENRAKLRELSLRMCLKIADLVKIDPVNWKSLAENTVMHS